MASDVIDLTQSGGGATDTQLAVKSQRSAAVSPPRGPKPMKRKFVIDEDDDDRRSPKHEGSVEVCELLSDSDQDGDCDSSSSSDLGLDAFPLRSGSPNKQVSSPPTAANKKSRPRRLVRHRKAAVKTTSQSRSRSVSRQGSLTSSGAPRDAGIAIHRTRSNSSRGSAGGRSTSTSPLPMPDSSSSDDWLHQFHPLSTKDLAIHRKKKAELSAWFGQAIREFGSRSGQAKLLVLSGPPGCGKSAAIEVRWCYDFRYGMLAVCEMRSPTLRAEYTCIVCMSLVLKVLAEEHGFEVRTWSGKSVGHFQFRSAGQKHRGGQIGVNENGAEAILGRSYRRADFDVEYQSELDSFRQFVVDCSRYQGLQLVSSSSRSCSGAGATPANNRKRKQLMVLDQLPLLNRLRTRQSVQKIIAHFAQCSRVPGPRSTVG